MTKMIEGNMISPCVVVYEDIIKNCDALINKAEVDFQWSKGKVGSNENMKILEEHRNVDRIVLSPSYKNDITWFSLSQLIWQYGNAYADDHNISFSNMEDPELLRYFPNEGHYNIHVDSFPGRQRIFSCIIYLNDVESGGETHFNRINLTVKPKRGRMVIFPSDYVHSHEAKTPKSGEKFVVVTWFNP
jgi:prolyl 4-hydroxylase